MISHFRIRFAAVALIGTLALTGCQTSKTSAASNASTTSATSTAAPAPQGDPSIIAVVKNGVLAEYNTTTVGKAFEGTFQNAKWSSFETAKGEVVVEFNGTGASDAFRQARIVPWQFQTAVNAQVQLFREGCKDSEGVRDQLRTVEEAKKRLDAQLAEPKQRLERLHYASSKEELAELDKVKWEIDGITKRFGMAEFTKTEEEASAKVNACAHAKPVNIPLKFQFTLGIDKKTFQVSSVDQIFPDQQSALEFIYR